MSPSSTMEQKPTPEGMSRFWALTDLFLWLLVLLIVVGGIGFWWRLEQQRMREARIHLSFRDANELAPGAVVRMMGVDVGYVETIRLKEDHVDVSFRLMKGAPSIPNGSKITILFTGLVGAKTVEITPPETMFPHASDPSRPRFFVEEPIRLQDALQAQVSIAEALKGGADNFARFFGQDEQVENLKYNIEQSQWVTQAGLNRADEVYEGIESARKDIAATFNFINLSTAQFRVISGEAVYWFNPEYMTPAAHSTARYVELFSDEIYRGVYIVTQNRMLQQYTRDRSLLSNRLHALSVGFNKDTLLARWVNPTLSTLESVVPALDRFHSQWFAFQKPISPGMGRGIRAVGERVGRWNQHF